MENVATPMRRKGQLKVNVELAAPDDFIPALPGWSARWKREQRRGRILKTRCSANRLKANGSGAWYYSETIHDTIAHEASSYARRRHYPPARAIIAATSRMRAARSRTAATYTRSHPGRSARSSVSSSYRSPGSIHDAYPLKGSGET